MLRDGSKEKRDREEEDEMEEEQRAVYCRFNDDIDEVLGISRLRSDASISASNASSSSSLPSTQGLNSHVADRLREIVAFGITSAVEIRKILRCLAYTLFVE